MHGGWQRLRDADKGLAYLRQAVVNRCRSVLRDRAVVRPNLQKAPPDLPGVAPDTFVALEQHSIRAALRDLPPSAPGPDMPPGAKVEGVSLPGNVVAGE